jgi:hypothetical protein
MITTDKIKELINSDDFNTDIEKLEKGQKAPASRIRKVLMEVSKLCKEGRKEVMEIKGTGVTSSQDDPPAGSDESESTPDEPSESESGSDN